LTGFLQSKVSRLGLGKVKPLALRMARFEGRFFIASQNSVIYIF